MRKHAQDAELLAKINAAVVAADEARAEHLSRSKTVGLLLLKAKQLHPAVKDFEAFLAKVQGLGLSRAYECMAVAGGRTTVEEIRKATRDRVAKHRASKKKLPGPTPAPKPEPEPEPQKLSVTVTETTKSARGLAEFTIACRTWLPQITIESDREKARQLVAELTSSKSKAEAA